MPGLIGFVENLDHDRARRSLADMAHALEPAHRYQRDLQAGDGFGLGRVSLGISNPETQPIWNEDETLCLVMEGEIYDYRDLKQSLLERGHRFRVNNDAEFVLHLYEEYGIEFAFKLNGAYAAAIWHPSARQLLLVTDRLGLQPLYYVQVPGGLVFGSGLRALLAHPAVSRAVDPVAMAEFLTFDHALGCRTLLQDVHLVPPASLLTLCDGHLDIRPYWTLAHPDSYQLCSEAEWREGFGHHLRQAVARQARDDAPAGILLSGGLDSRVLLAYLCDGPVSDQFHAFTWGIRGCDDARYAREISKILGVQHHFLELKPDWLLNKAEEGVRLTDGLGNVVNLHALATLESESRYAQVIYKGFMGDAVTGFSLTPAYYANYPESQLGAIHFQILVDQGFFGFDRNELGQLFTQELGGLVIDAVYEQFRAALVETGAKMAADQRYDFNLRQRVRRMTLQGVEVIRSQAVVRTPFCDNDLVEFMLAVPPGLRRHDRCLMKGAFTQAFPELAKVPYTETRLPLAPGARELLIRSDWYLRWRLRAAGLRWIRAPRWRSYKNYGGWFRTVLRDWVEETLQDAQTLQRGYFRPDYVRQLVREHMGGANHSVKLGALLTLELWHRQFLD